MSKVHVKTGDTVIVISGKDKGKKGKIMADQSVTVNDLDKDGQLTYDEALVAAHKAYNSASGYVVGETYWGGIGVLKLWGKETTNTMFFNNGVAIPSGVTVDTVKKGDVLYASVNADNTNYADWYTSFDQATAKIPAKRELTLKLTGFQGMAGGEAQAVKKVKVGTWVKGSFEQMDEAVTDDEGNVTLTFPKKGTYYVTASGEVDDVNWSGTSIKAPIMAPVCKVTVTKAKAEKPINVKMTVNNQGTIAKTKKNKIMWEQKVKVIDVNKDGKFSYDEALVAAHKAYSKKKAYVTKETEYGTSVTKLWGVETTNTLFFVNGEPLNVNVGSALIEAGDVLYASVNADNNYYSDWYTSFDKVAVTECANREITLNLTGFQGITGGEAKAVKGVHIGTWEKGKFVEMEGVTTDKNGNATFTFNKKGTYYVTASGTVKDKATDWSTGSQVDVDAPIMAPVCKVTVTKAKAATPATVELSVSDKGLFATANDGSTMFDKEITVKDGDMNGKVTVDELLVAAHAAFNKAEGYEAPGGYVSKLWGKENSNGFLFFVNDLPIQNGVAVDAVVTGDKVTAAIMIDTQYWMDFYTYFDAHKKTVSVEEPFTLNIKGYMGAYGPDTGAEPEETEVGLWVNGAYEPLGAYADEDGNVELSFEDPGTYLVTTVSDDYQDVIAAGCLVTVTE